MIDLSLHGRILSLQAWSIETGIPLQLLRWRLRKGWSAERALLTPIEDRRGNRNPLAIKTIHPDGSRPPEYLAWLSMKARCEYPKGRCFRDYGGRGIKVCEKWKNSYSAFLFDMGPRPTKDHSIVRIDNDGNYEPTNCRWATRSEQQNNRRCNRRVTIHGECMTLSQCANRYGLAKSLIRQRLDRGWDAETAVSVPSMRRG